MCLFTNCHMHREQRGPSTQRPLSKSNFRDVKWNGIESGGEGEGGRRRRQGGKKLLVTFSVCPWWLYDRDHFLESARVRREREEGIKRREKKGGGEGGGRENRREESGEEKEGVTRKK